ncbi:MAG: protein disulfide oxidoreductase [Anaerolineae bacterium]
MAILNDEVREQVKEMLGTLPSPVQLLIFTKPEDCPYCETIVDLTTELSEVVDDLTVKVFDVTEDHDEAEAYHIDKAPAIAIVGAQDYGLRFFGIPANYEFSTLLHGIQVAAAGASTQLDDETRTYLKGLETPIHYQVFVTPTCPYCPGAATLAYDMAVESPQIRSEVVEASEFQDLASKYNVMGVPLNVINDAERVEGRAPAHMILDAIKKVAA